MTANKSPVREGSPQVYPRFSLCSCTRGYFYHCWFLLQDKKGEQQWKSFLPISPRAPGTQACVREGDFSASIKLFKNTNTFFKSGFLSSHSVPFITSWMSETSNYVNMSHLYRWKAGKQLQISIPCNPQGKCPTKCLLPLDSAEWAFPLCFQDTTPLKNQEIQLIQQKRQHQGILQHWERLQDFLTGVRLGKKNCSGVKK